MCRLIKPQILLLVVVIFTTFSCGEFRKIEKSDDWKLKYNAALSYYEKQDYYRASILFEQILPIVRGQKEGEKVQFYLAYCNYYNQSYLVSSHFFKTFYETYARSEFAEEAHYMYAYSLYLDSPAFNLDQTSSFEAIDAMQVFINKYTQSKFRAEATAVIDQLQIKLERKAYENAKQYFKIGRHKSAIVAFQNFKREYPDSNYNEEIAFLKIKSEYRLAELSILSKQKERYDAVKTFYEEFIDAYPNSGYLKEAEKMYISSQEKSQKFANKIIHSK